MNPEEIVGRFTEGLEYTAHGILEQTYSRRILSGKVDRSM